MAGRPRLSVARAWIEAYFDALPKRVFSLPELAKILSAERTTWRLAYSTTVGDFVEYLSNQLHLRRRQLQATEPKYQHKKITRYCWRESSYLELGTSIASQSYLTHATAMFIHGLSDDTIGTVFVNKEQSPKPDYGAELTQHAIARAFSERSRQRRSSLAYSDGEHTYLMLSGKNTSNAGAIEMADPYGGTVFVSNLERTLIDIAVRPAYAGGVERVLNAYRAAVDRAQIGRLIQLLRRINYRYPYHQSIGYYATQAGFPPESLSQIRRLGMTFDFYLDYGLQSPHYDDEWRLFVPSWLQ